MMADGRLSAAKDLCAQHLRTLSAGAESSILQGLLLTMRGRPNEAVTAYDTALAFAPDALAAYQGIAQIFVGKGWYHSALVVMENARQAASFTPEAQNELDALRAHIAEAGKQSSKSKP